MNLHTALVSARKLIVASAVTMVAAGCLGSAATATSASAGHDKSASVSATKEWKVVSGSAATTNKTKEW